ncbi:hypothetical protein D0T12_24630 [Actinomadura spongiicola]|uniref:Uncharacterized protein n=1 Tax=Actinomadura spongiicola TaxID=2303421 RepID=A0A372GC55_9ACTN|nr:hypothetical protein [Actinomadura spongiicola]RFS82643.1 hypothetical protein D0T12_24630 [Actinomadura spongiicola]
MSPSVAYGRWLSFGVSAVLALLLSPITAIFATLIGLVGFLGTPLISKNQRTTIAVAIFGGLVVGSIPYLAGGLLIQ